MQKDLENLARKMQTVINLGSTTVSESYFDRLSFLRETKSYSPESWAAWRDTEKKILISDLYNSLIGQPPFTRDDLLSKQQLVKKGVHAFIEASDEEIEKFHKIILSKPSTKITTRLFQLFAHRQNTTYTHQ